MMGLREDLAKGVRGVRLMLPPSVDMAEDREKVLVANDAESGVRWEIRVLPWPLDLNPENAEVLRADVEADARASFDEFTTAHNGSATTPQWRLESPLLEVSTIPAGIGVVLRTIHRGLYQPGAELVMGTLVAPTTTGIVRVEVAARDAVTGIRESLLALEADTAPHARPAFDDEKYDLQFPNHSLSRVRAALAWALAASGGGLDVPTSPPQLTNDELELAGAGCTIRPPPRFLPVAAAVMGLSPGIETLARIAIATKPRFLDVWNLGPPPFHDADALECEARRAIEQWANEGASDIALETTQRADSHGGIGVDCFLNFRALGSPIQSVQRWFVRDDVVVRVSTGGAVQLDRRALTDDVARVTESLRFTQPLPTVPKKPWWKVW